MKFRSPNGADIRIATTSGHAAIIGAEWRELPEILHLLALSSGCECDQERISAKVVEPVTGEGAMNQTDADADYRKAIAAMIERNQEGDFTGADLPNVKRVSNLCGFTANKEDVYRVYREMNAEAGATDPAE